MRMLIDIPDDIKETLDRIESLSDKQLADLQIATMQGIVLPDDMDNKEGK